MYSADRESAHYVLDQIHCSRSSLSVKRQISLSLSPSQSEFMEGGVNCFHRSQTLATELLNGLEVHGVKALWLLSMCG